MYQAALGSLPLVMARELFSISQIIIGLGVHRCVGGLMQSFVVFMENLEISPEWGQL